MSQLATHQSNRSARTNPSKSEHDETARRHHMEVTPDAAHVHNRHNQQRTARFTLHMPLIVGIPKHNQSHLSGACCHRHNSYVTILDTWSNGGLPNVHPRAVVLPAWFAYPRSADLQARAIRPETTRKIAYILWHSPELHNARIYNVKNRGRSRHTWTRTSTGQPKSPCTAKPAIICLARRARNRVAERHHFRVS